MERDDIINDSLGAVVQELSRKIDEILVEAYIDGAVAVDIGHPRIDSALTHDRMGYAVIRWYDDPPEIDDTEYPLEPSQHRIERYDLDSISTERFVKAVEQSPHLSKEDLRDETENDG